MGLPQGTSYHLDGLCHEFHGGSFGAACHSDARSSVLGRRGGLQLRFGMAPRIAVASLTAFLVGSFLNAYVMSKMKLASGGKNFSLRAITSTLVGESADSMIFFPVAFGGLMPAGELIKMMVIQAVLKTLYEIIILPVTIRVVNYIKKVDGSDVFDEHISYNVLKSKNFNKVLMCQCAG